MYGGEAVADITVEHHHHIALDDDTRNFFLHLIAPVITALAHLEQIAMATKAETLDALAALDVKVTDLIADVRAALATLANEGGIGPEGQAAIEALTAKVDAFDAEVGDADGSDVPPTP